MATNLLIISHKRFGNKLKRLFEHHSKHTEIETLDLQARFFDGQPITDIADYYHVFERICATLDKKSSEHLRNLQVLLALQLIPPNSNHATAVWNPLLDNDPKRKKVLPPEVLASWLILSYPEIQWVFWGPESTDQNESRGKYHFIHPLSRLRDFVKHAGGTQAFLFDPSGLRSYVKEKINRSLHNGRLPDGKADTIPCQRKVLAAAIDEEPSYAFFHAYTAYRFGYRAHAVTLYDQFCDLFQTTQNEIKLVFEDIYLFFPDRPLELHLTDLEERDNKFHGLRSPNLQHRILVTVGHKRAGKWRSNKAYLKTLKRCLGIRWEVLYKPFAGIFDLWKRSGMWRRRSSLPMLAPGFTWPPDFSSTELDISGSHSTPGRLLMLAEHLLKRAEKLLRKAISVPDAIHAALLALEAKELIGCRTPTLALQAVALQHQSEIVAESMFYGIEYNLNVKDRFDDIEREVKAISQWFNAKSRVRSQLNARLTIIENLAKKFHDLNQFEEEQACLAEARKLRFTFWIRQRPWRYLAWPALKYLEHTLHSLPRFLSIVAVLILFFGGLYWGFNTSFTFTGGLIAYWESLCASTLFFFTLQPAEHWASMDSWPNLWNLFLGLQGMISFTNLTLLVTNIFLIVSRK